MPRDKSIANSHPALPTILMSDLTLCTKGVTILKNFFIIAIAVLGFNTSSCTQYNTFPDEIAKKVNTPEALKKTIDSKDSSFVIIDVRSEPEYKTGHIPTAINIPDGLIEKVANSPSRDKYIVVYCSQGGIAPEVGKKMSAIGYKYIFVLGGITTWPYELEASK